MKGRIWLWLGAAAGVAIGIGKLPYFAGAASTLSDTAQRIVGSAGDSLVHGVARHGAGRRIVLGLFVFLGLLLPGLTAFLLVLAARVTLRLRVLIGLVVMVLGVAGYHYLGHGVATGTLLMATVAAGIVVIATGPFVAAPLAALAALIATEYLPKLVTGHRSIPHSSMAVLHQAILSTRATPLWFEMIVLVVVAVPFALAARLLVT